MVRFALALAGALFLAACGKSASPPQIEARPALWEISGEHGEHGWLFGTLHRIPPNIDWQSPVLDKALAGASALVVEIADLDDRAKLNRIFEELARTPGQPLIEQRIVPARRPALARLLRETGLKTSDFANVESWAAALTIAQAVQAGNSGTGIDEALLKMAGAKPVVELEGMQKQLGLFDSLPEKEQRDLLSAIIDEAALAQEDRLTALWSRGDMSAMADETKDGMLADPELREVFLLRRNFDWAGQIDALLHDGQRPFVAAGAAHMAGGDGLPTLLASKGWTVRRIQ
jgi:uncharacterized protein